MPSIKRDIAALADQPQDPDGVRITRWTSSFVSMSPGVFVRVLGPVAVEGGNGDLSPALRRLLAILVARRAEVVSTESLVEWMWPDGPPGGDGRRALRTAVSRLRSVVGPEAVLTEEPGYRISLSPEQTDVGRFEASLAGGDGTPASDRLAEITGSLGLWRGEAWQVYSTEEWVRGEAVRLGLSVADIFVVRG